MSEQSHVNGQRVENEVFGLVYERYAFGKLLGNIVKRYNISSVLEIPGGGIKAMPSIYSLCMGMAGAHVTIVNGERSSLKVWKQFGMEDRVSFLDCEDITKTGIPDRSYDFVWNFVVIGTFDSPPDVVREMKRVSRKYVCLFNSNSRNIGFLFHKFAHWYTGIPWTHGDTSLRNARHTANLLKDQGLTIKKAGFVDTPPWPDAIGFRDIRLHRLQMENKLDLTKIDWKSDYIDYLQADRFPLWMKMVYMVESIPVPGFLKQYYAHLLYVIGETGNGRADKGG